MKTAAKVGIIGAVAAGIVGAYMLLRGGFSSAHKKGGGKGASAAPASEVFPNLSDIDSARVNTIAAKRQAGESLAQAFGETSGGSALNVAIAAQAREMEMPS